MSEQQATDVPADRFLTDLFEQRDTSATNALAALDRLDAHVRVVRDAIVSRQEGEFAITPRLPHQTVGDAERAVTEYRVLSEQAAAGEAIFRRGYGSTSDG